jgi:hypothetical protein
VQVARWLQDLYPPERGTADLLTELPDVSAAQEA